VETPGKLLEAETVFLSGVNTGLGRDTALLFASHGADLVITARGPDNINTIAEEVRALGQRCLPIVADVCNLEDCVRAKNAALAEYGKIDVLINIAYRGAWPNLTPLLETQPDISDYRACFEVNVFGTLQMTRQIAQHMAERKKGRIVMINTMTAEKAYEGSEAYSGSKIALQRMTRSIAMELGPLGIRVNSMHPGFMWGPQVQKVFERRAAEKGTSFDDEYKLVAKDAALRYIPPTSEYAKTLLFFASHLSDAVTGQSLHVNGGLYLH
jgi:NAD(P)-dependent dehydrogenase (short-subunit alcohol dehydrogenase family)